MSKFDLSELRERMLGYFGELRDADGPYGCIRMARGQRADLYSSVDFAITRTIMGEDLLRTVSAADRQAWTNHINSFTETFHWQTPDGSYFDRLGHSKLHANGQVVSALGVIGGKQCYANRLYDGFNTPEKIGPWLESEVNWRMPWNESHKFWGGLHCFSRSTHCPAGWLDACFAWLDANVDVDTGFWRKGVPAKERIYYLGGAVHILPIYEHLRRDFPCPERLADSVLDLQLAVGCWLDPRNPLSYMDLDALYVFHLIRRWRPTYRADAIQQAVERFTDTALRFYREQEHEIYLRHPHFVMATAGVFGLLSRLNPERVRDGDGVVWTDIFSDDRFHQTAAVEVDRG